MHRLKICHVMIIKVKCYQNLLHFVGLFPLSFIILVEREQEMIKDWFEKMRAGLKLAT